MITRFERVVELLWWACRASKHFVLARWGRRMPDNETYYTGSWRSEDQWSETSQPTRAEMRPSA